MDLRLKDMGFLSSTDDLDKGDPTTDEATDALEPFFSASEDKSLLDMEDLRLFILNTLRNRFESDCLVLIDISDRMDVAEMDAPELEAMEAVIEGRRS